MIKNNKIRAAIAVLMLTACVLAVTFIASNTQAASALWAITRVGSSVGIADTGQINLAPASGKAVKVTRAFVPYATKTALTPSANVTVNSTLGDFFTLTPGETENINATTVGVVGQRLFIQVVTSGTTSYTLTFNTNFKSTGTLATGTTSAKTFMISFLSDGTNYIETSRTAAQ